MKKKQNRREDEDDPPVQWHFIEGKPVIQWPRLLVDLTDSQVYQLAIHTPAGGGDCRQDLEQTRGDWRAYILRRLWKIQPENRHMLGDLAFEFFRANEFLKRERERNAALRECLSKSASDFALLTAEYSAAKASAGAGPAVAQAEGTKAQTASVERLAETGK